VEVKIEDLAVCRKKLSITISREEIQQRRAGFFGLHRPVSAGIFKNLEVARWARKGGPETLSKAGVRA